MSRVTSLSWPHPWTHGPPPGVHSRPLRYLEADVVGHVLHLAPPLLVQDDQRLHRGCARTQQLLVHRVQGQAAITQVVHLQASTSGWGGGGDKAAVRQVRQEQAVRQVRQEQVKRPGCSRPQVDMPFSNRILFYFIHFITGIMITI